VGPAFAFAFMHVVMTRTADAAALGRIHAPCDFDYISLFASLCANEVEALDSSAESVENDQLLRLALAVLTTAFHIADVGNIAAEKRCRGEGNQAQQQLAVEACTCCEKLLAAAAKLIACASAPPEDLSAVVGRAVELLTVYRATEELPTRWDKFAAVVAGPLHAALDDMRQDQEPSSLPSLISGVLTEYAMSKAEGIKCVDVKHMFRALARALNAQSPKSAALLTDLWCARLRQRPEACPGSAMLRLGHFIGELTGELAGALENASDEVLRAFEKAKLSIAELQNLENSCENGGGGSADSVAGHE
jgi:hypothetical protein